MRRFSILNLMGLVFAVAVAFAALRSANEWWAGGVLLATLGLLGFSALAAYLGREQKRAAWLGFLVMAGGYFLAVRTLPEQEATLLPTVQLVQFIQNRVGAGQVFTVAFTPQGGMASAGSGTATFQLATTSSVASTGQVRLWNTPTPTAALWTTIVPGAVNGAAFRSIGHNLFALLFGWLGAILARVMWARREAPPATSQAPPL